MIDESAREKERRWGDQSHSYLIWYGCWLVTNEDDVLTGQRIKQMRQTFETYFLCLPPTKGEGEKRKKWRLRGGKNGARSFQMRLFRDDSFSGINARMQREGWAFLSKQFTFATCMGREDYWNTRWKASLRFPADTREVRTTAMKNRTILSRRASNNFWSVDEELWILSLS